jgi:predicted PurR-regulated permease PerM
VSSRILLALIATVAILRWSQEVMVPILLGIYISYALDPAVSRLAAWKLPRAIGSAVVLAIVVGLVGLAVYVLADDFVTIIEQLPEAARNFRGFFLRTGNEEGIVGKVQEAAKELETTATEAVGTANAPQGVSRVQIEEKPLDLSQIVWWGSVGILGGLSQVVLLLFFVYFLLLSGNLFRRKVVRIAGAALGRRKVTVQILDDIHDQIRRFIMVQLATGMIVGVASWMVFSAFGLQGAAVWGIAAGLANSIPYVGPLVIGVCLITVAVLQFGAVANVLYVAAAAVAITTLEGWLLTPWLMGRAVRMNGVSTFIGLMFFAWLWGVWGVLLAVPTMATIKSICDHVDDLKPLAELLGE